MLYFVVPGINGYVFDGDHHGNGKREKNRHSDQNANWMSNIAVNHLFDFLMVNLGQTKSHGDNKATAF
ncbi:hypothetical protein NBRC116595_24650 [Aliiglaciecola sp. NS0011-25]